LKELKISSKDKNLIRMQIQIGSKLFNILAKEAKKYNVSVPIYCREIIKDFALTNEVNG